MTDIPKVQIQILLEWILSDDVWIWTRNHIQLTISKNKEEKGKPKSVKILPFKYFVFSCFFFYLDIKLQDDVCHMGCVTVFSA